MVRSHYSRVFFISLLALTSPGVYRASAQGTKPSTEVINQANRGNNGQGTPDELTSLTASPALDPPTIGSAVGSYSPQAQPVPSGTITSVLGSVTTTQIGYKGQQFEGLSYDLSALAASYEAGLIDGTSALIPLFKALNPDGGVLRLGSDGADTFVWTPNGSGHVTSQISPPDIQNLGAFAAATGYQVILGLNLAGLGSGGTAVSDLAEPVPGTGSGWTAGDTFSIDQSGAHGAAGLVNRVMSNGTDGNVTASHSSMSVGTGYTTATGVSTTPIHCHSGKCTGLKVNVFTPETTKAKDAEEASYVYNTLGPYLKNFELGNEPASYMHANGGYGIIYRPSWPIDTGVPDLESEWSSLRSSIMETTPGATFSGPGTSNGHLPKVITEWAVPFALAEASSLQEITVHYYRNTDLSNTGAALLLPDPTFGPIVCTPLSAAAAVTGLPLRFPEVGTGAQSPGGLENGAALWAVTFDLNAAACGADGVNWHGGDGTTYSPITNIDNGIVTQINPVFYGIKFANEAGAGPVMATTQSVVSGATVQPEAWAIRTHTGYHYVVVNGDGTHNLHYTVELPKEATKASLVELTINDNPNATTGTKIQGSSIGLDGSFSPQAPYTLNVVGGQVQFYVPAYSAVIVYIDTTTSQAKLAGSPDIIPNPPSTDVASAETLRAATASR